MEKDEKEFNARGVLADLISYRDSFNQTNQNNTSALWRRLAIAVWMFGGATFFGYSLYSREKDSDSH